jgi:hypothetical protein
MAENVFPANIVLVKLWLRWRKLMLLHIKFVIFGPQQFDYLVT